MFKLCLWVLQLRWRVNLPFNWRIARKEYRGNYFYQQKKKSYTASLFLFFAQHTTNHHEILHRNKAFNKENKEKLERKDEKGTDVVFVEFGLWETESSMKFHVSCRPWTVWWSRWLNQFTGQRQRPRQGKSWWSQQGSWSESSRWVDRRWISHSPEATTWAPSP